MFNRRPDAKLAEVPTYRRVMPYIMPGRNESAFYFEQDVDMEPVEAFLAEFNAAHPDTRASLFHVVTWAAVQTLHERPRLNRFVVGNKIWDRDGIWISYAAKKTKLVEDAPLVTLKRRFDPSWSFAELVEFMAKDLQVGRSDAKSTTDKELGLLMKLPGCGISGLLSLLRLVDRWGLLPRAFIDSDPLYASLFVANLGSLKMDAGYHHLFEYGNTPIFCVIGRTREVPVVVDGEVRAARRAVLRYTYDERIEDGLYAQRSLEHMREMIEGVGKA